MTATNLFDNVHQEYVGAPAIGRLIVARCRRSSSRAPSVVVAVVVAAAAATAGCVAGDVERPGRGIVGHGQFGQVARLLAAGPHARSALKVAPWFGQRNPLPWMLIVVPACGHTMENAR